jgi:hypothetical protein
MSQVRRIMLVAGTTGPFTKEVPSMRMYELWKLGKTEGSAARLEDEGGPVLFPCVHEAEEYSRREADHWEASFAIVEVRVGIA